MTLPTLPIENPILIFAILLLIILLSPIMLRRFKIPYIIGMIAAGILLGPNGLDVLALDSSVELYGTVGMLYIMFLSGVEVDIADFRRNKFAIAGFGLFSFAVPMVMGIVSSIFCFNLGILAAVLLGSVYASHTLIAYPIVSRFGVAKTRAVNIAVVGTIVTNTLSLLVFAVVAGVYQGSFSFLYWLRFGFLTISFGLVVLYGFPWIARRFFKKYSDNVTQYVFVMALVLLAAFIGTLIGLEGIIGAFLAGIALNKLVPSTSGLMNRIDFVGNAIFIPFFLIKVGMLVNVRAFISSLDMLKVALIMAAVATFSKYFAALFTRKCFKLKPYEGNLIFGLSNAQAAATIAVMTVCLKEGWLNETIFNGTIMMVLVTCIISTVVVEKATRDILDKKDNNKNYRKGGRLLIAVNNLQRVERLFVLAKMVRNPRSREPLFAIHVIDKQNVDDAERQNSKGILERAATVASGTDTLLKCLAREEDTVATGIVKTCQEQGISDIIMGMGTSNITQAMFTIDVASVLRRTHQGVMLVKLLQPPNTFKRIVVAVPPQAEYEAGFSRWLYRLSNLHKQTQAPIVFYANEATIEKINLLNARSEYHLKIQCHRFDRWDDFLIMASYLHEDDLFTCVLARRDSLSYAAVMEHIPSLLSNYFRDNNILIIYPEQYQSNETKNPFA
ncbi:sodium:proton antiporter [Bacteroidia bacterium]|nr:sodium:proton antiporter [Bacteroidia bacterium]